MLEILFQDCKCVYIFGISLKMSDNGHTLSSDNSLGSCLTARLACKSAYLKSGF